jgi:hypothetical protein
MRSHRQCLHHQPASVLKNDLQYGSLSHLVLALQFAGRINVSICDAAVDSLGMHNLSCPNLSCRVSAGRIARHTAVYGIIKDALTAAEVPCRLKLPGLTRDDGKRPDGVTTMPWKYDRCLVWDVSCQLTL